MWGIEGEQCQYLCFGRPSSDKCRCPQSVEADVSNTRRSEPGPAERGTSERRAGASPAVLLPSQDGESRCCLYQIHAMRSMLHGSFRQWSKADLKVEARCELRSRRFHRSVCNGWKVDIN